MLQALHGGARTAVRTASRNTAKSGEPTPRVNHQPAHEGELRNGSEQSRRCCLRRVSPEDVASAGSSSSRPTVLPSWHNQKTLAMVEPESRTDDTVRMRSETGRTEARA